MLPTLCSYRYTENYAYSYCLYSRSEMARAVKESLLALWRCTVLDSSSLCCANCGTPLTPFGMDTSGVTCLTCQFFNSPNALLPTPVITLDALGTRLSDLVAQARASALPLNDIVHVLRNELEFTAELASGGRDLCIQIIDLGPRTSQIMRQSRRDDGVMLRGRSVGG